jgi:WD40 repeat protein
MLASGDELGAIRTWDAVTGAPIGVIQNESGDEVTDLAAVPVRGGRTLLISAEFASFDEGGALRRWDAVTGAPVGPRVPTHYISQLTTIQAAVTPQFMTADGDHRVRRWNAETGELLDEPLAGSSVAAAAQPDGTVLIAAGGKDGSIRIRRIAMRS